MRTTFNANLDVLDDQVHKYNIARNGERISYAGALNLWQEDERFRSFFVSLLSESPFPAFRWETPPITIDTINGCFEFVLLNAPELDRTSNKQAFENHFTNDNNNEGIVEFENLGKDALLVVPSPRGPDSAYGHLAAFVRGAPEWQKHALWRVVGQVTQRRINDRSLWLSTAGGGVPWLHVRLDSTPKYYGYTPYRTSAIWP